MNETGYSSAKSQTKPMPSHPLLKSSRGRVLWPDQRPMPSDKTRINPLDDHLDDTGFQLGRSRQRTSSVTSIETIRLKVKARVADALLKPKLPLDDAKRSTRKRTHSATSPEVDADADSGALQTGPRVRQRRDSSNFNSGAALQSFDERLVGTGTGTAKAKMPTGASSALRKLKEKLTPAQATEVCDATRDPRSSLSTKPAPSAVHVSKTKNNIALVPPREQPTGAATIHSKPVADLPLPPALKSQPLQSLSTNTNTELSEYKRPPLSPPIRRPIPGARLNKYGCYELQASEFELAVTFPSSERSNFEVWDQEDELFLVGPLSLHLTLRDPAKWDGVPVSHPDVYVLEIKCGSKAVVDSSHPWPYGSASKHDNYKYSVGYEGAKMRNPVGKAVPPDPRRGITIDTLWMRTYAGGTHATPTTPPSSATAAYDTSTTTTPLNANTTAPNTNANSANRRGWEMQFFVPIATRLFEKRETRAFQVEGLISVWGEQLATPMATMSVSHLMREREMVVRR
ncbi:hypothetical protein B0H19DRAFT_1233487 [Mycena capillaripes]|nr:hypothetical protein B0H19DRAFT_1233487 [Mycena capillaripes]